MSGKRAKAPCGHEGEVVVGGYVQCPICEGGAVPKHVTPEKTQPYSVSPGKRSTDPRKCAHPSTYQWSRMTWCTDCGKRIS